MTERKTEINYRVGGRIAYLRSARVPALTQDEFAALLSERAHDHITKDMVVRWERGGDIENDHLHLIADFFGCAVENILSRTMPDADLRVVVPSPDDLGDFAITVDHGPELRFRGHKIAMTTNRSKKAWLRKAVEYRLYQTGDGKLVAHAIKTSADGSQKSSAAACDTPFDVITFFGHGPLARKLYAATGIDEIDCSRVRSKTRGPKNKSSVGGFEAGARIRELRMAQSLTLSMLADLFTSRSGERVTGSAIGGWEHGVRTKRQNYQVVADVLGCDMEYLLNGTPAIVQAAD